VSHSGCADVILHLSSHQFSVDNQTGVLQQLPSARPLGRLCLREFIYRTWPYYNLVGMWSKSTSTSGVAGAKRLELNSDKIDLLWFGPASQLRHLPSHSSTVHVSQCVIKPVTVVRDLGRMIPFDAELSMRSHVSRVTQTCFGHLHQVRAVRRQLGLDVTARLVTALVLSRLDYCNAVLAGLPASTLAPFQRVLHAVARTV